MSACLPVCCHCPLHFYYSHTQAHKQAHTNARLMRTPVQAVVALRGRHRSVPTHTLSNGGSWPPSQKPSTTAQQHSLNRQAATAPRSRRVASADDVSQFVLQQNRFVLRATLRRQPQEHQQQQQLIGNHSHACQRARVCCHGRT